MQGGVLVRKLETTELGKEVARLPEVPKDIPCSGCQDIQDEAKRASTKKNGFDEAEFEERMTQRQQD